MQEAGAGRKEGRPFSRKAKTSVTENFGMFVPEADRSLKKAALSVQSEQAVIPDHRATPSGHLRRRFPPQTLGALRWAPGAPGAQCRESPGQGSPAERASCRARSTWVPVLVRTPAGRPQTRTLSVGKQGGLVFPLSGS